MKRLCAEPWLVIVSTPPGLTASRESTVRHVPIPRDLEEPPGDPDVEPPVEPAHDELPFAKLTWEEFEKLCLRLAKRESDIEDARRFGDTGQSQSGIDMYARKGEQTYVVYQCRRVAQLTAAGLRTAVDDFLDGAWASKATEFVFCTSKSAVRVQLAEEVERQRQRLHEHDPEIRFRVWDAEALSDKLRRHADLVELFFGRAWLEAFLPTAARADVEARLTEIQRRTQSS